MIVNSVFFSFFSFFFLILLYFTFQSVLVLPYINMNLPQVYMSSHSWTPLPSPSPYHLSGSSQCTSPKHPVSCIKPRLAIRFLHDIIHVSMPFSQIIPPSSSPTESKVCFIHLWLFCCLVLSAGYFREKSFGKMLTWYMASVFPVKCMQCNQHSQIF